MNFDTEALLAAQMLDWTANCPTKMWARVNVAWLSGDVRTIDSGLLCERSVRSMYPPCGNIALCCWRFGIAVLRKPGVEFHSRQGGNYIDRDIS